MKTLKDILVEEENQDQDSLIIPSQAPELTPQEVEMSPEEIHQMLILKEASGAVPAITRFAKIVQIIGDKNNRIFVLECFNVYMYLFEEEAPDEFSDKSNDDLIGQLVRVKPVAIKDDKIICSHKVILRYYSEMLDRQKILFGKIKEIKPYPQNKKRKMAILVSKGDYFFVPQAELTDELLKSKKNFKDKVIGFVVIGVDENRKTASIKRVSDFHKDTLLEKLQNGETVTMRVGKTDPYGAVLFYKNDIECYLRNKDFTKDFISCQELLKKGDKLKVRLKTISGYYQNIYVEPAEEIIYEKADTSEIKAGDVLQGKIFTITPFGCFVRIGMGKDALCAIEIDKREPMIGENVEIEIISADHKANKMRAKITKYIDEKLDLSKYNLLEEGGL